MTINERIFNLLKEKKHTQKYFSQKTGIPETTISTWKKRNTDPAAHFLFDIANFLDVSLEFLLTGNEENININSKLKDDEIELLENYNKLDKRGKHKLHTIIYEELDRIENNTNNPSTISAAKETG